MTSYQTFVADYPTRCIEILDKYLPDAQIAGREVTLAIAIASTAIVIPYERLNPSDPSHLAPDRSPEAVKKVSQVLNKSFTAWSHSASWFQFKNIEAESIRGRDVEQWLPEPLAPVSQGRKVQSVLAVLRNSLSHGNLFLCPSNSKAITKLVFLSRASPNQRCCQCRAPLRTSQYEGLVASPADLIAVVRKWVDTLNHSAIPEEPI